MKQLASFAVLNVNGGQRVTYTFDIIDENTGDVISTNNKGNFYAIDSNLKSAITQIRNYISNNKLAE